jgi:two-component system, chemotaxis family, response regulator Rcp1
MAQVKSRNILLVEDNDDDVELTNLAFRKSLIPNRLHVVKDGIEGLAYLQREGEYAKAPRPDLILLDLNMPRMDGRELLSWVKSNAQLKKIPVIVLTTSESEADVARAYDLHANAYMVKPVDFTRFADVTRCLTDYWFALVRLPRPD